MTDATVLLISKDCALIESVRRLSPEMGLVDLSVVESLDQAYTYGAWSRVALVLIHHERRDAIMGVVRLLRMLAAARRPVATVVLADGLEDEETTDLLRMGVADILPRPIDMVRLAYLIDILTLRSRQPRVPPPASATTHEIRIWDESEPMIAEARRVAPQDATVLISGDVGTGKSRLARAIHDLSPRQHGPFVTIRCSTLAPDGLTEELFGRDFEFGSPVSGLGRLDEASEGTLLLDDIDTLSPRSQAALVRWIEDDAREAANLVRPRPKHPRLIATSRSMLSERVTEGRFRSDLFFRLNVIGLSLVPLRERPEEVGPLAAVLLAELGGSSIALEPDALHAIESHSWHGNVRELREVLESALAHRRGPGLGRDLFPGLVRAANLPVKATGSLLGNDTAPVSETTLAQTKCEAECARITQALEKNGHNRLRTASELGISRMTLYKKLYKYGIIEQESRDGQLPSGRSRRHVSPAVLPLAGSPAEKRSR